MSSGIYTIRPRDPLFARSASPFTADPGAQATTLDWPLPQTIAGALRTHIGEARRIDWSDEIERKQINSIAVHGGFLIERGVDDAGWMPFFPAPHDAHIFHDETTGNPGIHAVRPKPLNSGEGVNFPRNNGLTLEPLNIEHDEKPLPGYDLWSLNDINTWLLDLEQPAPPARHRGRLAQETRMHVTVESTTGTAKEGHLFATSGIAFSPTTFKTPEREMARQAMLCQITTPDDIGPLETPSYFTLGGEQRQARLGPKPALSVNPWDVPKAIVEALAGQTTFRLQLVTPALFRTGWYPGWISQAHRDRFPDVDLIANETNLGFGRAVNLGADAARGDLLVLLNNDLVCEPGFIKAICAPFADRAVGMVAGVLTQLRAPGRIDSAGIELDVTLGSSDYLGDEPVSALRGAADPVGPCGGAAASASCPAPSWSAGDSPRSSRSARSATPSCGRRPSRSRSSTTPCATRTSW